MKRCPECNTLFPDLNRFCDLDGTPLIDDQPKQPSENWKILAVGAIVGVSLGIVLFLIYFGLSREHTPETASTAASTTAAAVPAPPPLIARPEPEQSPSPEPSPSPSASPTPSPSPSPAVKLSSSPISTSLTASTRVIIRLKNGSVIDADEAWEGKEGIWYRRNGVVVLLDPAQVNAVEHPSAAPSPSPSVQP